MNDKYPNLSSTEIDEFTRFVQFMEDDRRSQLASMSDDLKLQIAIITSLFAKNTIIPDLVTAEALHSIAANIERATQALGKTPDVCTTLRQMSDKNTAVTKLIESLKQTQPDTEDDVWH